MPPTPQKGHTSPHRGRHGVLRFGAAEFNSVGRSLAEDDSAKICCLVSKFLNFLVLLVCRRGFLYNYGVVNFSCSVFCQIKLFRKFSFAGNPFICCDASC